MEQIYWAVSIVNKGQKKISCTDFTIHKKIIKIIKIKTKTGKC